MYIACRQESVPRTFKGKHNSAFVDQQSTCTKLGLLIFKLMHCHNHLQDHNLNLNWNLCGGIHVHVQVYMYLLLVHQVTQWIKCSVLYPQNNRQLLEITQCAISRHHAAQFVAVEERVFGCSCQSFHNLWTHVQDTGSTADCQQVGAPRTKSQNDTSLTASSLQPLCDHGLHQ